ncbi:nitrate/nitrite transporter [Cellulomonas sp. PhB143]|uniref:MFS transporter n=1 Tax=Cellulomonas sp. PhB143 TaxID=2485186 RepID=UPI001F477BFC|nr:MFS transporter [Cellulomonas sp. PhB143]
MQLGLSTAVFAVNFWAWALLGPLGGAFAEGLGLDSFQQSAVVAVPVIVGSLGRIPVGALTDRYGARLMFPLITFLTILPVLFVGYVADSYATLLLGGFFLGLGGTTFAIGVPFNNAWFPPARRGTAIGIFGAGMGGTAIASFTTVPIADAWGREAPFLIVAIVLAVFGVLSILVIKDSPDRPAPPDEGMLSRFWATFKLPVTLQLSWLYAIGFGGFVAFSVYLPTLLVNQYDLSASDAASRTAGFVVVAVIMRPVGGVLSDRIGGVNVSIVCFGAATLLAAWLILEPDLVPGATIAYLGLAFFLGASTGSTFALVAELAPPSKVGGVTGVVGAIGGLGGFIPPLVMGAVYGNNGSYGIGFLLLTAAVLATFLFTLGPVRRRQRLGRAAD